MPEPRASDTKSIGRRRAGLAAGAAALCLAAVAAWLYPSAFSDGRRRVGELARAAAARVNVASADAAAFFGGHPYFAVREVKVTGVEEVQGADLVTMTGLVPHAPIWGAEPTDLEERVRRHPWVKRALVRRELPGRLTIAVEEWEPGGIVALDRLYYVADDGGIFKPLDDGESVDFPFVTGLRAAGLVPEEPGARAKLSEALELARAVERTAFKLSEIRFLPGGGIVLYPVSYAVPFHMGWGDWDDKLVRLRWFLRQFREQGARFAAVDLSFKGQVVTRPRKRA